jgi:hypothetical protein
MDGTMSTLDDPKMQAVLDRLHDVPRDDLELFARHLPMMVGMLRAGSVVLADDIKTFRRSLQPVLGYVASGRHGLHAPTLLLADAFEYAVRLG